MPSGGPAPYANDTPKNHKIPRNGLPRYIWPTPGTMLSTSARIGLNPGSLRSSGKRVTGAPHDLQKLASATTIG